MREDLRELYRRVQLAARQGRLNELDTLTVAEPSTPPPPPIANGTHLEFNFDAVAQEGVNRP